MPVSEGNQKLLIYAGIGYFAYQTLFGEGKEEKKTKKDIAKLKKLKLENNPFETSTYKAPPKVDGNKRFTLTGDKAKIAERAAVQIYEGIGFLTDDESKIIDALKKAQTFSDVFLISGMYSKKYKRNLWHDLESNLGKKPDELGDIVKTVLALPKYVTGATN